MRLEMTNEDKFLPQGYRYLGVGERILKGDYFWNCELCRWSKVQHVGDMSNWVSEQIIRQKK